MSRLLLEDNRTKVVYIGLSGKCWHLSGPNHGLEGVRLGEGAKGMVFAPFDQLWSEGARQDGATWLRSVRNKRELDLVIQVQGRTPGNFRAINDEWWRELSTDRRGVLAVFTKYSGWRFIRVRLASAPEPQQGRDPALICACDYDVVLVADDPLWYGFPEKQLWVNTLGMNEGNVNVRNAADQEAWPQYVMKGPGKYFIEDPMFDPSVDELRIIETPKILAGETLMIDTHPRRPTARLWTNSGGENVRNVWAQLGGRRWLTPVKPWTSSEITVRVEQGDLTSQVAVVSQPRFSRPW